jgi:hypothetical protein
VGDYAPAAASTCPPVLVCDAALHAPDVHGAHPPGRPSLSTDDRTAQREADLDRLGPRGHGGGAALGPPRGARQPQYPPTPGARPRHANGPTTVRRRHRRLGKTQGAYLWHHRGGLGLALPGGPARGPHRRDRWRPGSRPTPR